MNLGRLVWVNTIPELVRIALVKFLSNPWLTEGSLVFLLCHHVLCTFRQRSLWAVHTQVSDGTSSRIVSCVPNLLPSASWLPIYLWTYRRTCCEWPQPMWTPLNLPIVQVPCDQLTQWVNRPLLVWLNFAGPDMAPASMDGAAVGEN